MRAAERYRETACAKSAVEVHPGPAHRLVIRLNQSVLATFTYDENTADRQTFFYLEQDNKGNIGYREDWTLERTH